MKYISTYDYSKLKNISEPDIYKLINKKKIDFKHFGRLRRPMFIAIESVPEGIEFLDGDKEYLSIKKSAKKLKVQPESIKSLIDDGILKCVKIKGYWFIDEDDLNSHDVLNKVKSVKFVNFVEY